MVALHPRFERVGRARGRKNRPTRKVAEGQSTMGFLLLKTSPIKETTELELRRAVQPYVTGKESVQAGKLHVRDLGHVSPYQDLAYSPALFEQHVINLAVAQGIF